MKARTTPYPPALRATVIKWYLWEAGFALRPSEFEDANSGVLGRPGNSAGELRHSLEQLQPVVRAVEELCAGQCRARGLTEPYAV